MSEQIEKIFKQQEKSEKKLFERELRKMMVLEYQLSDQQRREVEEDRFCFPACEEDSSLPMPEQILTRTQDFFSVKIHYIDTSVYFHRHDFVEMLYVYRGSCTNYIEDLSHKVCLNENELILINQNVTHAVGKISPEDVVLKMILPREFLKSDFPYQRLEDPQLRSFFCTALKSRNEYYGYMVFRNSRDSQVKTYMEQILKEYHYKNPFYQEAVKQLLGLLFLELVRNRLYEEGEFYLLGKGIFPLKEILDEIEGKEGTVTLEYLSGKYGYNESYLSRRIRELTGSSFMELLTQSRYQKAIKLLADPELPLEYIASRCGYQNVNALYRLIKKVSGKQPGQLRQQS